MAQSKKSLANPKSITMRDVARLAGVSQSTVSRVLSHSTSSIPISEETYKRVLDAVEKLGYYPNVTARSLRRQQTEMIAILIADISNPFYHSIVRSVQDIARHHKYDVLIANSDHLYENERHFCEAMMRRPVDGIIMVPYHLPEDAIDQLMHRTGAEVVILGQHSEHPHVDTVHSDDEQATYDAICWLILEKRHERVAFIGVDNTSPGARRQRGYEHALQANDIPLRPEFILQGDWSVESGQNAMRHLLELREPPTAVFACNDHMAIGALNTAIDMGRRIPEEVAIIGFDNIPATTLVRPKLTTIAQHPVLIGELLAKALFERIEGVYSGPKRAFRGKLELIQRDST
jgi:LacI family transcriptional regulator